MSLSWTAFLNRLRRKCAPPRKLRRTTFRPQLEQLEDRITPSVMLEQHLALPDPPAPSPTVSLATAVSTSLTLTSSGNSSAPGQVIQETATLAAADGSTPLGLIGFTVSSRALSRSRTPSHNLLES